MGSMGSRQGEIKVIMPSRKEIKYCIKRSLRTSDSDRQEYGIAGYEGAVSASGVGLIIKNDERECNRKNL
jgi:hypothetical protein